LQTWTLKTCSCPKNAICPLDGNCLAKKIIYQATVTQGNSKTETYIGLTATTFKARLGNHFKSFRHEKHRSDSMLSNHLWELSEQNINYDLSWKLIARANTYSPVTGFCPLCNLEKFLITFKPELGTLNSRNEIFTNCRHKLSVLLDKT
jgi:hypothetical protein